MVDVTSIPVVKMSAVVPVVTMASVFRVVAMAVVALVVPENNHQLIFQSNLLRFYPGILLLLYLNISFIPETQLHERVFIALSKPLTQKIHILVS